MSKMPTTEIILSGIPCAPGITIGKAYLVDRGDIQPIHQYTVDDIESEKRRFRMAVHSAEEELLKAISKVPKDLRDNANILKVHVLLLKDKLFFTKIVEFIGTKKVNAEWALKCISTQLQQLFLSMTDSYLQERTQDIQHITDLVLKNLRGNSETDLSNIDKRVILVAKDLSPAQASQIQLKWIVGLITEMGGITSHTSIVARTLGLPAVAGIENCTTYVGHGEIIIVDGTNGKIVLSPKEETLVTYEEKRAQYNKHLASLIQESREPVETKDGRKLTIFGNVEFSEEINALKNFGGEGIGLYRTEFQYLNQTTFPSEQELFDRYAEVAHALGPDMPITIRTLDINGDKAIFYKKDRDQIEGNPALGLRGIRYGLKYPDILKTQIRAILRAASIAQIEIMFPVISSVEEVRETKKIIVQAVKELEQEKIPHRANIPIGIMIEVPSAVMIADLLAKEVDFFSIGTNDLIQYTLAIDRGNNTVASLYQPLHPAILRMLQRTIEIATQYGVNFLVCGEMAGDPLCIPLLVGMGVRKFSMNPSAIPVMKKFLRNLSAQEATLFVKNALQLETSFEIEALVRQTYKDFF